MINNKIWIKINALRKKISKLNYYYYEKNQSKVSDQEFDSLLNDLINLENKYPEFKNNDSPTLKVGGTLNNKFYNQKHKVAIYSLANAFNFDDLISFDNRIKKKIITNNYKYFCEYKIDGVSISLEYENGILITGLTRGDGISGEVITQNILEIKSIPKKISYKGKLIVRGEIFLNKSELKIINDLRIKANKKPFLNTRNTVSGTIRQLESKIVKERNLSCFFYYVYNFNNNIKTQEEQFQFLKANNFPINEKYNKLFNSIDEVLPYLEKLSHLKDSLNYDVDGIVLKLNNVSNQNLIGFTSKFPKWAIAYKFLAIMEETILKNIIQTVGRTGKISYIANFEQIKLEGSIVSCATLHNASYIIKNDIRINDYILIKKAGQIIPKVIKPVISKRTNQCIKWIPDQFCINCNTKLIFKTNQVDQFCPNKECSLQKLRKLEHFVSKNGFNIVGINSKILKKLIDNNIITTDFSSIFKLKNFKDKILKLEGMGIKQFNNLIKAINLSKTLSLSSFLNALGILYVGKETAKILAKNYKTINDFFEISISSLELIPEIGNKIANSVFSYFSSKKNKSEIKKLLDLGIIIENKKLFNNNQKFLNQIFVITGKLIHSRNYYINLINKFNGKISSSLSKKTTYLLVGENPGSKLEKSKKFPNIKIINENYFEQLIKN